MIWKLVATAYIINMFVDGVYQAYTPDTGTFFPFAWNDKNLSRIIPTNLTNLTSSKAKAWELIYFLYIFWVWGMLYSQKEMFILYNITTYACQTDRKFEQCYVQEILFWLKVIVLIKFYQYYKREALWVYLY